MKVNLKNYDTAKDFEPIPVGWYQAEVNKVEQKTSKDGKPYLNVWFKILEPGEHSGRIVFRNFTISKKTIPFMKSFLIAIGYPDDECEIDETGQEWITQQCMVYVDHEIYNGKTKERAKEFISLVSEGRIKIISDDKIPDDGGAF